MATYPQLHGHSCWADLGLGIRLAQDMGAHRRRGHTTQDELWTRAFWYELLFIWSCCSQSSRRVLVSLDRTFGAHKGLPTSTNEEEFVIIFRAR